ncbi:hypothetical protein B0S89_0525 [Caldicellulosiruptor bescii]|nr:hypothetical protein B0S89_0525 [Caldicellulosiruptor bescii]
MVDMQQNGGMSINYMLTLKNVAGNKKNVLHRKSKLIPPTDVS